MNTFMKLWEAIRRRIASWIAPKKSAQEADMDEYASKCYGGTD